MTNTIDIVLGGSRNYNATVRLLGIPMVVYEHRMTRPKICTFYRLKRKKKKRSESFQIFTRVVQLVLDRDNASISILVLAYTHYNQLSRIVANHSKFQSFSMRLYDNISNWDVVISDWDNFSIRKGELLTEQEKNIIDTTMSSGYFSMDDILTKKLKIAINKDVSLIPVSNEITRADLMDLDD